MKEGTPLLTEHKMGKEETEHYKERALCALGGQWGRRRTRHKQKKNIQKERNNKI